MANNSGLEKEKTADLFATEKVDVVKNALLGDYTQYGEYVIAQELIDKLVLIQKEKTGTFMNSIFCEASLEKYGKLQFEIVFKKNSKTKKAVCELYLLEQVEKINGYMTNTIKTPLVKYVESLNDTFIPKALTILNVVDNVDDDEGKELQQDSLEVDVTLLESRKKFNLAVAKLTNKNFEKAYETYFNKRVALLKGQNTLYSKEVLNSFNEQYNKIEKYFFTTKTGNVKYKALNELLDNTIESLSGLKPGYENDEKHHKEQMNSLISDLSNKIEEYIVKSSDAVIHGNKEFTDIAEISNEAVKKNENTPEKAVPIIKYIKEGAVEYGEDALKLAFGEQIKKPDVNVKDLLSADKANVKDNKEQPKPNILQQVQEYAAQKPEPKSEPKPEAKSVNASGGVVEVEISLSEQVTGGFKNKSEISEESDAGFNSLDIDDKSKTSDDKNLDIEEPLNKSFEDDIFKGF